MGLKGRRDWEDKKSRRGRSVLESEWVENTGPGLDHSSERGRRFADDWLRPIKETFSHCQTSRMLSHLYSQSTSTWRGVWWQTPKALRFPMRNLIQEIHGTKEAKWVNQPQTPATQVSTQEQVVGGPQRRNSKPHFWEQVGFRGKGRAFGINAIWRYKASSSYSCPQKVPGDLTWSKHGSPGKACGSNYRRESPQSLCRLLSFLKHHNPTCLTV